MRRTLMLICLAAAVLSCKSGSADRATADPPAETRSETARNAPAGDDGAKAPQTGESMPRQAAVVTDADAESRTAPNGKGEILRFMTGENAFLGKLTMDPGGKVPPHRDPTEEYIYVLEGTGVMTIDGTDYDVGPNTAIYMPANAEVTFQNGDQKLVALQVFAGPGPAAKYDDWTSSK